MIAALVAAASAPAAPAAFAPAASAPAASAFAAAPADARAVTVAGAGDGRADDGPAIQRALDVAADRGQGAGGIVFLPSGRYRVSRTLFVWPGVRIVGVGPTRPAVVLGARTPGFARGLATVILFAGARAGAVDPVPVPPPGTVPARTDVADANSGTFYSGLANVDVEIGPGNPAATGVRFRVAQHGHLQDVTFRTGSGLAGVYQAGNVLRRVRFEGGRYGILSEKTSPAWPSMLVDAEFAGQRDAAIREHEMGLTMENVAFRDVPVGVEIDRGWGDWLWGRRLRFERVRRAAFLVSNEASAYTQVGVEDAAAAETPIFARMRDSGRALAGPGGRYRVRSFTHGWTMDRMGEPAQVETRLDAAPDAGPTPASPTPAEPAIRPLPPVAEWANVRDAGAAGDDRTDDTAAIQRAVDAHRTVYFPAGFYRVTAPIRLRPDSVLVALHPGLSRLVLTDGAPAFADPGTPRGVIESAAGGDATVWGLGVDTGGTNPGASGIVWRAGERSLVGDVKFQGGHGTDRFDGTRLDPYDGDHTADPDPKRRWDGQRASLWVRDGGGGTFHDIWSPSTFADAGIRVSDTATPGRVLQVSVEHHARAEIVLERVRNWDLIAPQTEEEAGESGRAVALDIRDSSDILVANLHAYRVTRSRMPAPAAVRLSNSGRVRFRNVHVNAESGYATCDAGGCTTYLRASKYPYADAIRDDTRGASVREREFAVLDVPAAPPAAAAPPPPAPGVEKLADGFQALGGATLASDGTLFFVDRPAQRVHAWDPVRGLRTVLDATLDAAALAADASGGFLILSSAGREGRVYHYDPAKPAAGAVPVAATPVGQGASGKAWAVPGNWWVNGEFRDLLDPATLAYPTLADLFAREAVVPVAREYRSPDASVAIPAYRVFSQGEPDHRGFRFGHALDAYGLVTARPGEPLLVTNGSENRTYRLTPGADAALTAPEVVAERGGEGAVRGADGRTYVLAGQVFVHDAQGREVGRIDLPERPIQIVAGRDALFALGHHALYRIAYPAPGERK